MKLTRGEVAGAFGDIGTLIPFVIGYVSICGLSAGSILFAMGITGISCGLYYKTPIPIQPMKVIGAYAIANKDLITHGMIYAAALITGIIWLFLGSFNLIKYIGRLFPQTITKGIMVGLGFKFIVDGGVMMKEDILIAIVGIMLCLFLFNSKSFPAMFGLLLFGVTVGLLKNTAIIPSLKPTFEFFFPQISLFKFSLEELYKAIYLLVIPQLPLTFANSVLAITKENNDLFPNHPITYRQVSISLGLTNILSSSLSGVPICHGAGGLAGHYRFGARTNLAIIIMGSLLLILSLLFTDKITLILKILPTSIVGVVLFFAGIELASTGLKGINHQKELFIIILVAGLAIFNMVCALVGGIIAFYLLKINLLK